MPEDPYRHPAGRTCSGALLTPAGMILLLAIVTDMIRPRKSRR